MAIEVYQQLPPEVTVNWVSVDIVFEHDQHKLVIVGFVHTPNSEKVIKTYGVIPLHIVLMEDVNAIIEYFKSRQQKTAFEKETTLPKILH